MPAVSTRTALLALLLTPMFAAPSLAAPSLAPRDPFAPFDTKPRGLCAIADEDVHAAACVDVDAVVVRGVVSGTAGARVLVDVKGGGSVVLRVGDVLVGGRIAAIRRDGVVVERVAYSQVALPQRMRLVLPLGGG